MIKTLKIKKSKYSTFENVDCQLKEIYETLTIMFSKNEHETERRLIRFIQEEDGKKYLGKDYLYP